MPCSESDDDDSCSSTSLPDLEPVENFPASSSDDQARPETYFFRLAGSGQTKEKLSEAEALWADPPERVERPWEAEVRMEDRRLMQQPCNEDLCEDELGYPKWPDEMKDPEYFKKELQRMREDPRNNANRGRSMEDQEFWNEAARLPWAKVLLRKEQYWTERRNVWLQQYGKVVRGNRGRLRLGEELEECSVELRRLVAPVLHCRVVEQLLLTALEEADDLQLTLSDFLEDSPGRELLAELNATCCRLACDTREEQDRQATLMQEELDGRLREAQQAAQKELDQATPARTIIDMEGLRVALEYGQKCRKDGLVEYQRGNFEEALHSWRQGDLGLRRFRAPMRCEDENTMLRELHGSVLRNLSQAALKLGRYGEALDAANRAIALTGGRGLGQSAGDALGCGLEASGEIDVKAWYRRHLALEGLGHVRESAACLQYIEEAATCRPDGERLRRDCQRRREKMRKQQRRRTAEEGRMVRRGLRSGVFAGDRPESSEQALVPSETSPWSAGLADPAAACTEAAGGSRGSGDSKHLTHEGATELLEDLRRAYTEPSFVRRVDKLSKDVRFDAREFAPQLARLSFEAQTPILKK